MERYCAARRLIAALMIAAAHGALFCCHAGAAPDRAYLAGGVGFGVFFAPGGPDYTDAIISRARDYEPPAELIEAAREAADAGLSLAIIGSPSCGDCAAVIPIAEAAARAGGLATRFFGWGNAAKEFLTETSGIRRIPAIFVTDSGGAIAGEPFIERPARVKREIGRAADDAGRDAVIAAFRAGKYDDEIARELAAILRGAAGSQNH